MAAQEAADGTPFGRYRLMELLGRGGMGEVWRAHDSDTDRIVAIKVLPAHLSDDEEFQRRFRREAHAAARLNNPHVIPIHNYGEIDGCLYVDMRLIEGRDLGTVLAEGPLDSARAVRIVEQVANALHAAHKVGLVHRDVKPSNVLLDEDDFAYLIDFGIARAAAETRLTSTGNMLGTFQYMAPERFSSSQEDARADIYALACVLYECLTDQLPYPGDSMPQQYHGHVALDPPRPTAVNPTIPAGFDNVIARGMAKDPQQRYDSALTLAVAAREALTTAGPAPPPIPSGPTEQQLAPPSAAAAATLVAPEPPPTAAPRRAAPTGIEIPVAAEISAEPPQAPSRSARGRTTILTTVGVVVAAVIIVVTVIAINRHSDSGAQTVMPFTGLSEPEGIAVDGAGAVYVADYFNSRVVKVAAGSTAQTALPFTDLKYPDGVAVDSTGTVYVADWSNNRVVKLAAGSSQQTVLPFTGLNAPEDVAVDSTSAVYVADTGGRRVVKLAVESSRQTVPPFTGLNRPVGVAVDSAGAIYVADTNNNRVLKLGAGATQQTELPFTGLNRPFGVAVDGSGAIYVADTNNNQVLKLGAGATQQTVLAFTGLHHPYGVAVDGSSAIYVTDSKNNRVVKLQQR